MRRPNHASRFEGIAKTNLQASKASDTETLQSQVNKAAKKRLSLSGLEILHGRLENLAVEQLIAKAGVEALDVAVLPGAAPLDVGGLGTDSRDPSLHSLGDELRSVVGADVSGDAPQDEQVGQNVDHIDRLERAGDTDRQTFVGELVEHV